MISLPSMVKYASGASRGWPDLAPVVVSSSRVRPFELATHLAAVGTELVDDVLVERLHRVSVRNVSHFLSSFSGFASIPDSLRCCAVIGAGAPVSGSTPPPDFGNAITSRIDS